MIERRISRRNFLKASGIGVAGAALFGVAGCGGGQQRGGQQGGAGGLVSRGDIRIVMMTHGPASDPFWSVEKTGADQAAADLGIDVEYRGPKPFDIPVIQHLYESVVATKPDGIAATVVDPDALGPIIRKAVSQDIPVVMFNSGREDWEKLGALTYIGQTEIEAGIEAGKRMAEAGVTNALCINHQQGVLPLDQRCSGFDKGLGGSVKQVAVNGDDPTAAENGIKVALRQNPDANGMITLGPAGADPALKALKASGKMGSLKFGTFDLSPSILNAVKDGEMLFAIDQEPFLQAYLAVTFLTTYIQYGLTAIGEVRTGPAFVTKENAQQVISLSKQGIR